MAGARPVSRTGARTHSRSRSSKTSTTSQYLRRGAAPVACTASGAVDVWRLTGRRLGVHMSISIVTPTAAVVKNQVCMSAATTPKEVRRWSVAL